MELLLAPNREFYFLEMNTRLQVEHPDEAITGADLVEWQLRVAQGEPLPITQDQLTLRGHAIEARLYAEDPARNFAPATGRILALTLPDPALARVDHWLTQGQEIGAHYDALLAKIICHGEDREQARRKLSTALEQLRVLGVQTNQAFLCELVAHEVFVAGEATTDFLDRRGPQLEGAPEPRRRGAGRGRRGRAPAWKRAPGARRRERQLRGRAVRIHQLRRARAAAAVRAR